MLLIYNFEDIFIILKLFNDVSDMRILLKFSFGRIYFFKFKCKFYGWFFGISDIW